MISTLVGLAVGALVTAILWPMAGSAFDVDALRRTNYRGAAVLTGAGVLIPVTVVLVAAAARIVVAADDVIASWDQLTAATLVACLGLGLLGLFDDVVGAGQSGGFGGHLAELGRGHVGSGVLKLVGGAAVGVLTVSVMQEGNGAVVGMLRDGASIALAANLGNLFDRAPGRATKVSCLAFVLLALLAASPALLVPAVAIGSGIGLLAPDLRERAMLGDAGANVLGAVCGLAALEAFQESFGRWVLLLVLLGANLLSEVVSFSRVIDSVAPLRWFDRLGSSRPDR